MSHHVLRYRRGELEGKLRDTGFEILFSTSYAAIVLPLMAVSCVLARRSGGDVEARVQLELDAPRLVNAGLRFLLHTEVWLTLKGLRWPAGAVGSWSRASPSPPKTPDALALATC